MTNDSNLSTKKQKLLAKLKRKRKRAEAQSNIPPITAVPRDRNTQFPLSRAQKRLMFNYLREPEASGQNVAVHIFFEGDLNIPALEAGLNDLIERHEILRAAFITEDNETHMTLPPFKGLKLIHHQAQTWTRDTLDRRIAEATNQPFKLEEGESIAAHLFQVSDDAYHFLIVKHHIVSDGWSIGLLQPELIKAYNARLAGHPPELPEQEFQYIDFASWESKWLVGQVLEEKQTYWTQKLRGMQALELPTDRPRPSQQEFGASTYDFYLSPQRSAALFDLNKNQGVTSFMSGLALFQLLLFHYSGQRNWGTGMSFANRTQSEVEGMQGFFVNMLVLRTSVDEADSFSELLKKVKKTVLGAFANPEIALGELMHLLKMKRDFSRHPVFQVVFAFQNLRGVKTFGDSEAADAADSFKNLKTKKVDVDAQTSAYDLSLHLANNDEQFRGLFTYPTHLFEQTTIQRLVRHFEFLIDTYVANPAVPMKDLPMLDQQTRAQQVSVWNHSQTRSLANGGLHTLITTQFQDREALAVRTPDASYSYELLEQAARAFASSFSEAGVGLGDVVGVCLPASFDLLAAMLAAFRLGATYLPLDPTATETRLEYILEDSGAKVLVAAPATLERLGNFEGVMLSKPGQTELERTVAEAELPAYIIYTSGSTGNPKGVILRHHNAINFLSWWNIQLSDHDALAPMPVMSNPIFDASMTQLLAPLLRGAYVWFIDPEVKKDPKALVNLLKQEETFSFLTPNSLWYAMLDEIEEQGLDLETFNLRYLPLGSEKANEDAFQRSLDLLPDLNFTNNYGPTETTVIVTWMRVKKGENAHIGRPIHNTDVYIHNPHGGLLPTGAAGELLIGGDSVALGYLNRPALTATHFVPHPYSQSPGERLYRSGDLVRFLGDGNLDILGRIDQQVKIRGYRIEPGEIESALRGLDGIGDAAVVIQKQANGDPALVAFVVAKSNELDLVQVRSQLTETLPDFMIPSAFGILESLPLGATGKIDRKLLTGMDVAHVQEQAYRAPQTEMQIRCAALMAELLGVDRIGLDDNFFEMGGHSILAVKYANQVGQSLDLQVSVNLIFENPTVDALVTALEALENHESLPPITPNSPEPAPLSFSQKRLRFIYQLEGPSPIYNIPMLLEFQGPLSIAFLQNALDSLVSRHKVLRTLYQSQDEASIQVLSGKGPVLNLIDLSSHDLSHGALEAYVAVEMRRCFKIDQELPVSASLLRLDSERHLVLFNVHHIAFDGSSTPVFMNELRIAYSQAMGLSEALPDLPVTYNDYATWQHRVFNEESMAEKLTFWNDLLHDAPPVHDIPLDQARPAQQDFRGGVTGFHLDAAMTQRLQALSNDHQATLYMTLLAGFGLLLMRYSGSSSMVIGTPHANRDQAEIQNLIGFFVNTLCMRLHRQKGQTLESYLRASASSIKASFANSQIPFDELVEKLNPERSLSFTPIFQVMFSLLHEPAGEGQFLPGIQAKPLTGGEITSKFDLSLALSQSEHGLTGNLTYARALFGEASAVKMGQHYVQLLQAMIDGPKKPLAELDLMTESEHKQLLEAWHGTATALPQESDVFAAVRKIAEEYPQNVAVEQEGIQLTYSELMKRVSAFAHAMRGAGVGVGDVVALCRKPDPDFVAAMLAIFKLGAIYLPLDPSMNQARLNYMLQDSEARLLVAESDIVETLDYNGTVLNEVKEENTETWTPLFQGLPAYIIYTSGSTGKPKGTLISHFNILNFLAFRNRLLNALEACVPMPLLSNPIFDASFTQLLAPLLRGDAVWLLPAAASGRPELIFEVLKEKEALALNMVNSLWLSLLSFMEEEESRSVKPKLLMLGGEALTEDLLSRTWRLFPDLVICNNYGPTETTVNATVAVLRKGERSHLGKPLDNMQMLVTDGQGYLLPTLAAGEARIGGAGVGLGYLKRPRLTAERFVPDPFSKEPGSRLYRSGDKVRISAEGEMDFLGRLDHQIKLRGFRIELGEIEAAIHACEQVEQAAVLVIKENLQAFVQGQTEGERILANLSQSLPAFMVPTQILVMDELPLLRNGKIDRKALPALALDAQRSGDDPPEGPIEQAIAEVFQDVLSLDRLPDRNQGFFALGGHSLSATRVIARLGKRLGHALEIRALFQAPTIKGLAAYLGEHAEMREARPTRGLTEAFSHLPLSFNQLRLWLLDQIVPGQSTYNMSYAFKFNGALDVDALEEAFRRVITRHDILRTRFPTHEGQPYQHIDPVSQKLLNRHDYSGIDEAARESSLMATVRAELDRPFDLSQGPIIRLNLYKVKSDEHILCLCIHHIAFDGSSMPVLLGEVATAYGQLIAGSRVNLPELPAQYGDFSVWQTEQLQGAYLEKRLNFWRTYLAEAPLLLELPTDLPRPTFQSYRGGTQGFTIPATLATQLQTRANQHGLTMYMILQSLFAVLLGRMANTDDLLMGTPTAGRNETDYEKLIGFFINTVTIRSKNMGQATLGEFFRQSQERIINAFDNQDMPFERLVEELVPQRNTSTSPIFQVMLTLQNFEQGSVPDLPPTMGEQLSMEPLGDAVEPQAKFDLSISIASQGDGYYVDLSYCADLFRPRTMEAMGKRFLHLVEQVVEAADDMPVRDLSVVTPAEARYLINDLNQTQRPYERDQSISAAFEAVAAREPQRTALCFRDESLTYAELNRLANRIAHHLQKLGLKQGDVVATFMERSTELMASVIAIVKMGCAYLPLDAAFPADRLGFMLDDSRASIILSQESLVQSLPPNQAHIARIVEVLADEVADTNPGHHVDPLAPANVIYTSGSTGRPKGVVVQNRNVMRLVRNSPFIEGLEDCRFIQLAPIAFDLSTLEIWAPLLNGGTLVVMTPGTPSLEDLGRTLKAQRVTHCWLTAGLFHVMVENNLEGLSGLQYLLAGGDVLLPAAVNQVCEQLPQVKMINGYGPTENTTFTSCHQLPGPLEDGFSVPIGKPIANTSVYILDPHLNVLPVGVYGHLYTGGDGVSSCYLNRPALTASVFIADPFSDEPGSRIYATGDKARWLADGTIEFAGRIDQQVKLRGFRIELGEIEASLAAHPNIAQAAVLVHEKGADKMLLGYYQPVDSQVSLDAAELKQQLALNLPDYMVPSQLIEMVDMPLNASLKIDRKALAALAKEMTIQVSSEKPEGPQEEIIAAIFQDVLGLNTCPGRDDHFFDLGGHSLSATRVIARICRHFECEITLRELFEAPTVQGLARKVMAASRQMPELPTRGLMEGVDLLPLSYNQMRLWLLDQIDGGSPNYNITFAQDFIGKLQVDALENAFQACVSRHQVLRTRFPMQDNQPYQHIDPVPSQLIALHDMSGAEQNQIEAAVAREFGHVFDLQNGPVLRVALFKVSEERHILSLNVHHIAFDGSSFAVLLGEVASAYAQRVQGRNIQLPELPAQYGDFAIWQKQQLSGDYLDKRLSFWKVYLEDAPMLLELPTDLPRPTLQSFRGADHRFELPSTKMDQLLVRGKAHGLTLYMMLQSLVAILLGRMAHSDDVLMGSPVAGRNQLDYEKLIGFFINTVTIRTSEMGRVTLGELFGQTRRNVLNAFENQDMPFERLVEELQPQRSTSYAPIYQVMFTLQNFEADAETDSTTMNISDDLRVEAFSGEFESVAKYDLSISIVPGTDVYTVTFNYCRDLFLAKTIEAMGRRFVHLIDQILEASDATPVHSLRFVTSEEARYLVHDLNQTHRPYEHDQSIPAVFRKIARRNPEGPALIFGDERNTYDQLDKHANRVAHLLLSKGMKPGDAVAVFMDRSIEIFHAMLGAQKAGGAYLPIDPTTPSERIGFMLRDSDAPFVITQAHLRQYLPETQAEVIVLGPDWDEDYPSSQPPVDLDPLNPGNIIYTSGTTGKPKGVLVPQQAIMRLVRNNNFITCDATSTFMMITSVAFDAHDVEVWLPLLNGSRIVILPPGTPDFDLIRSVVRDSPVTHLLLPVALFHVLAEGDISDFKDLKVWMVGGDVMHPHTAARVRHELPQTSLINAYGPTENGCMTSYYPVDASFIPGLSIPIGLPLANSTVYITDANLALQPSGAFGELVTGGDGLAQGYLDRPALTAAMFVPDPFSKEPGSRLYKTGDKVRWRADEKLEFGGRLDTQVKLRGFRIELGEIEDQLQRQDGVHLATVLLAGEGTQARLVAFLQAHESILPQVQTALEDALPTYMRPSQYVCLEEMPTNTSGKVDRKKLKLFVPELEKVAYVAPQTDLERTLCDAFAAALAITEVGMQDDFFEIGGHSLAAVRLSALIYEATYQRIPLPVIFQNPTPALLAAHLERSGNNDVIQLKPNDGTGITWLLPPIGGQGHHYANYAQALEGGVMALQDPRLTRDTVEAMSLETLVKHYRHQILEHQPAGPYRLGGWSMGGMLAFELTRSLEADGYEVAQLILIDTLAQDPLQGKDVETARPGLLQTFLGEQGVAVTNEIGAMEDEALLSLAKDIGLIQSDAEADQLMHLWHIVLANAEAVQGWKASQAINAMVHHTLASETEKRWPETHQSWSTLTETFQGKIKEGNHFSML